ncbi:MAG: metallophosphatase family protein [Bacteroidales bacterium]|nr:metallophosphatase family protein [Bacteroidales bacterium]
MKIFNYPDVKTILVCGDIHGNFEGIVHKLCVDYDCMDTLLIVAGDCGFGFKKPEYYEQIYSRVAGMLRKANNSVAFIRGNHDDPSYFAEEKVHHQRWRCVPDYSVIRAWAYNILCIGGATSVDRKERQEMNARMRQRGQFQTAAWWPDEVPVFLPEVIDSIFENFQIDTVVTHTAPSFCETAGWKSTCLKPWATNDPALLEDVDKERATMDKIYERIAVRHWVRRWFYGHFHWSWCGEREHILFTLLGIEEFKEIL